jgi:hypothetical protein
MLTVGHETGAGGGVFLLLEHGVEICAQAGAGGGRGRRGEELGDLGERGKFALAIRTAGKVGAGLEESGRGGARIEQLRESIAGALAIHGKKEK